MSDSNVGLGMVPCRKGCRCDECTIERLTARITELEAGESSIISLLESLETMLCTGQYNDRVANALALIAEIMGQTQENDV